MSQVKHAYETQQEVSNGNLVANFPLQKDLPTRSTLANWFLPRWETLIVAGREVKGFVVTPAIAGVILAFMLGLAATIYWRVSDQIQGQRDLIIELRTSLKEKAEHEAENRAEVKDTLALHKVYIDNLREKQIESDSKRKN